MIKKEQQFSRNISAILAVLPLALSCVPWGILCGTLSIQAGLSNIQAQMMSLCIFAGAAQLSGIAILGAGGSWLALINSTVMIGSRHLLYSATYHNEIVKLPLIKRVFFAFLLTDEMFVISQAEQFKKGYFDYWYAIIAGFTFYLIWNIATFSGIYFAHLLQDVDQLGLDFAIAATFIAMVIPMIKKRVILMAVITSGISILTLNYFTFFVEQGLVISALIGMIVGYWLDQKGNN
ncbi:MULTISPECIES: AzlC family ABC transporter permease [Pasteurellaceae]|uniref:AzlC family ABC transporter permease n=1 Tax=Pasteurella atlantica TaxID=2827233 RepID=A0AAW8CI25_9PAST|nr:AzlC family ABC transporter permease [Pasteurella atlantica]MBR0572655.1 AzlC family ABC transporter permease [Pasteurella atlantica]MDP8038601.1 AzlC family ABC transporter permease [Pasteurella atlantica]MDP8040693.1 AzlC family ABC transporter permease [Pasteurella atlantica]MDP8042828.1 AzlC family ABC transporter permease [Pasteurella atlantica]MDP8044915.1 AzlC family ABC transporter permease [Pasteurella atlantica]